MLTALFTVAMGIADELNTAKRARTPSPEQLQMRVRWAKYQQDQIAIKEKIAQFDSSLANIPGKA